MESSWTHREPPHETPPGRPFLLASMKASNMSSLMETWPHSWRSHGVRMAVFVRDEHSELKDWWNQGIYLLDIFHGNSNNIKRYLTMRLSQKYLTRDKTWKIWDIVDIPGYMGLSNEAIIIGS